MKRRLLGIGLVLAALVALALLTLALPVDLWRTGRQPVAPLALENGDRFAAPARRIWIDTDAACGVDPHADPDDCFALLVLFGNPALEVAGISTVFGNAPLDATDRVTRELVDHIEQERAPLAVHRGSASAAAENAPAHAALQAALEEARLTIVALGPLTNIAAVLRAQPELRFEVVRIIAVMGRRPGHVFHPTEGSGGAMLFGHGPIFRDLNFISDPHAAQELIRLRVPLILVPYDAARGIELTGADLARMHAAGGAAAWVAERARGWLAYWRENVGRDGFYPFDLVGAAFAIHPAGLRCARVPVRVGDDARFRWPFRGKVALLAGPDATLQGAAGVIGTAVYCPEIVPDLKARLLH
jgi:purine nucleosidase